MNRQLKFRAWNGIEMVHDVMCGVFGNFYVNPGQSGNGLDKNDSATLTPFNTKFHEDVAVMQFTGLIDKNGKEVFEGDIIKWKTTRFHTEEQKQKGVAMPKFFTSPILFHEGTYLVNESDEVSMDASQYDTYLCAFFGDCMDNVHDFKAEVIGNIYENPELLQSK